MWLRDGEPVVEAFKSAAGISTEIAEEIRDMLAGRYGSREHYEMQNETEFGSDSHYEESGTDSGGWPDEWAIPRLSFRRLPVISAIEHWIRFDPF